MERGKKIRSRRRAAALAGSVAVIAAAVACVPALASHQALPPPAVSHIRVTVNPPGPHSPAGTIASGLIGSKPWSIRIDSPLKQPCVTGPGLSQDCATATLPTPTDPIASGGMGTGVGKDGYSVTYGVVRKDVASARVVLADGTVLTLHPATVYGRRWVAFADPYGESVTSLTAYSLTGEIATSIPFTGPSGYATPSFITWLRPGQAGAKRSARTIGSGTTNGHAWRVTAYVGPWGICTGDGGSWGCNVWPETYGGQTSFMGSSGTTVWGEAADSVSYLIVTPKNGAPTRVGVTAIGGQKFWAFNLSRQPTKGDRWTAYDAAGKPVASGSLPV